MWKQNRIWLALFAILSLCVLLNGCDRVNKKGSEFGDGVYDIEANEILNTNEIPKENKTPEANTLLKANANPEADTMITKYNQLLQQTLNVETVYQFIEDNIDKATPKEAQQLILGLFGYLNDVRQVDYERLEHISDSLPEDVKEFVVIMKKETKKPAIIEGDIKISLTDLLLRCQELENHMDKYEEGLTYTYTKNLYFEELAAAITGGYDKVNKKPNLYLNVDKVHIEEKAYNEYVSFLKAHKDTQTSDVVERYIRILDENNKVVNENVTDFYKAIYKTIKEELE